MGEEADQKIEEIKTISFKAWVESRPFWERYLWQLHAEKDIIDAADIDKCYKVFLDDQVFFGKSIGQNKSLTLPAFGVDRTTNVQKQIVLDKIGNLENVNAVSNKCSLDFGTTLTVIYGDNGTGKSGIGRLFSNACLSRKPRKLLPNAKANPSSKSQIAKADFHISDSNGERVINYTMGDVHEPLKCFSVFDSESAPIHLDSENEIKFIPSKIRIFDEVFKSISTIEDKLRKDIETRKKDNPAEGLFTVDTKISDFCGSLSHTTSDNKIDKTLNFISRDQSLIDEKRKIIEQKQKQDIARQKKDLLDECLDLELFKDKLNKSKEILSEEKSLEINKLIEEIEEKKEIADKLSVKNFEFASFKCIGSGEWKALIIAAKKLYEKENDSNEGVELEHCVLCRQSLNPEEKTLFCDYWKFLESTAESELSAARQKLSAVLDDLKQTSLIWPTFSDSEIAIKISKRDIPKDLTKIQQDFIEMNAQLLDWTKKIKKEQRVAFDNSGSNLSPIDNLIKRKHEIEEKLVDPADVIEKINKYITYLEQKKQAFNIKDRIKAYISWLRWEYAVRQINLSAVRGLVTRKKTEIMNKLVVSQYDKIFNEETEKLNCKFGLNVESHGRDANTIKELKLGFAPGYNPSEILSEGEQTVASLADFLTEARIDQNNCGMIFDDPVNSLDHLRMADIAQRLVEESTNRQVIVFTHDIVFLLDLQFYAERNSVECKTIPMRRIGDKIGITDPELPWIAQNVKARVGYLKNELQNLKKIENGDQDKYRNEVKIWHELLREAWERAVEERLFKGVVQRFNRSIQTQRLSAVSIDAEMIKEIDVGMTDSSRWLHDLAAGVNPAIPQDDKLNASLKLLEDFITKCKAE